MPTTTVALVRTALGALGATAVFDDAYIEMTMSEAAALHPGTDLSTALGARLHRLETARMLATDYLGRIQGGAVQRFKEHDIDIDLGDLRARAQAWDEEIRRLERRLTRDPPGFGWVTRDV